MSTPPLQKSSLSTVLIIYANGFISLWFFIGALYTFFYHPKSILCDIAYKTEPVASFNFMMLQNLEYKTLAIFFLLISIFYMIMTMSSLILASIWPIIRKNLEWMGYAEKAAEDNSVTIKENPIQEDHKEIPTEETSTTNKNISKK